MTVFLHMADHTAPHVSHWTTDGPLRERPPEDGAQPDDKACLFCRLPRQSLVDPRSAPVARVTCATQPDTVARVSLHIEKRVASKKRSRRRQEHAAVKSHPLRCRATRAHRRASPALDMEPDVKPLLPLSQAMQPRTAGDVSA